MNGWVLCFYLSKVLDIILAKLYVLGYYTLKDEILAGTYQVVRIIYDTFICLHIYCNLTERFQLITIFMAFVLEHSTD